MPLTAKGPQTMVPLKKRYGAKRGTAIFYALMNKGKTKEAEMHG